jgi:hypothetical protein
VKSSSTGSRDRRGQSLPPRAGALAATAAGIALLVAACGGGGSPAATGSDGQQAAPPASHQAAAASSIPPARQAQLTKLGQRYTACMRSHGITNFPDPPPGGGLNFEMSGIDTRSSSFHAAVQACQHIMSETHKLTNSA